MHLLLHNSGDVIDRIEAWILLIGLAFICAVLVVEQVHSLVAGARGARRSPLCKSVVVRSIPFLGLGIAVLTIGDSRPLVTSIARSTSFATMLLFAYFLAHRR